MSEDNSGRDKYEQPFEQLDDDQAAHLDSLIAQFEGDCDIDLPIETDRAEPPAGAEVGLNEATAEPEPTNSFGILLAIFVAITLLGMAIWQNFADDDDRNAVIDISQPVTNSAPVQTAMLPVAPATRDQQAAITVSENRELPAAASEQHEPQAPKQEQTDIPAQVTPPTATKQHVDPVTRKVVTPRSGMAWAVNLTSVSTLASAEEIGMGLASRGITSEVKQVTVGGKSFYRIHIPGFSSKQEAERARLPFLQEKEFSSAWLQRYRTALRSPE